MPETNRIEREREFHNTAFADNTRAGVGKFYSVAERAFAHYSASVCDIEQGAAALEYGCGVGSYAFRLSELGAKVVGIDISEEAIAQASAKASGLGLVADFKVMNAESLDFPDASFDLVCGSGILHHLDLEKAYSQIARVIKPSGRAVFLEPLGHNILLKVFRSRTPGLRTQDEHPLLMSDIALARKYFSSVKMRTYCFVSLLAIPFNGKPGFHFLLSVLSGIDSALFTLCPPLRRYCWIAVIEMTGPKSLIKTIP
ncbi:MAG: class I SAM-dependent methyltransferase [bacterium]|jgi:SAM-dependent methyltransferase